MADAPESENTATDQPAEGSDSGAPADAESPQELWREYFAFEEPYQNQGDAVERIIEAGKARGYLAMEGPCGTGKTMAALTAGATLVRDTDLYDRILVVTPVKQQLQQFVEDLRAMNTGLDDPFDGISLVGKRDLCPYEREELFPDDESVYDRCESLRENTAHLIEADGGAKEAPAADAALENDDDEDEKWWDPGLAKDLAAAARPDGLDQRSLGEQTLGTDGVDSPYRPEQPRAPESMVEDGGEATLFCPFEADWYARNKGSPIDFSDGRDNVVTIDEYLPKSVERGTCPHRVMQVMLQHADVVIGNYNHLFDPKSRTLLTDVLDENTFVVVDEAHRLEERVRDLLSSRVGKHTLTRARNDCNVLRQRANQSTEHKQQVKEVLNARDVPLDSVEQARAFYDDVIEWLDQRVRSHLDGEVEGWRADPDRLPERDIEVPLRDPDTVEQDDLTKWAMDEGYDGSMWRTLARVGAAVDDAIDELGLPRSPVAGPVGAIMNDWWEAGHASFLREIELEYSEADERAVGTAYETRYTPGLLLYNCMPARAIREILDGLGGGVLMSATLEPLDVFTQVAGLRHLEEEGNPDGRAVDGDGRIVREATYDLPFPEENRASYLVDVRPFTARNRGDPTVMDPLGEEWNPTRDEYAHALRALARSPGNVLVAMPSYAEAAWAGAYLQESVEKRVLVDESSSNEATERLKQSFFSGEGRVLVTSARGTLTEGVDYDGAKLSTCAVVGVPLVNIGSPRVRAVQRAYGDAFGDESAFEYALTVPAVRRARQAIGRVIRGVDEIGVRAFVGRRYCPGARHSVFPYLSPDEREEFTRMTPEFLADQLDAFWSGRRP